jgi:hypothetical protein
MPQPHEQECSNEPSPFRLQHGNCNGWTLYDEAHRLGVIDAQQHSDMVHYNNMRAAFLQRNQPRDTVIGKLTDNADGIYFCESSSSLAEKYFLFIREVPLVTQKNLAALSTPMLPHITRKQFYAARTIIECHLDILRRWLDGGE